MAVQTETRKFKVAEFYKLGEVGILSEDERVELLDGQIMIMAPIGSPDGCRRACRDFYGSTERQVSGRGSKPAPNRR